MNHRLLLSVAAALLAGTAISYAQAPGGAAGGPAPSERAAPGGGAGGGNMGGAPGGAASERAAPAERAPGGSTRMKGDGADTRANQSGPADQKNGMANDQKPGAANRNAAETKDGGKDMNRNADGKTGAGDTNRNADSKTGAPDTNRNAQSRDGADKSGITGQAAAGGKLNAEQRTQVTSVIRETKVAPVTNVNFNISIGTRVPRDVSFHPLPARIVTIYPDWRGYEFFLVRDEIIIVNPRTFEIVAVLPA